MKMHGNTKTNQRLGKAGSLLTLLGLLALAIPSAFASDGKALADKHQCTSCHKVEGKLIGPSFEDVAEKYKGDAEALDKLTVKVRQGSKGVWGSMPMLPNKSISDEDLKTVINWILTQCVTSPAFPVAPQQPQKTQDENERF